MNKKFTRLIALLLAMLMMMSSLSTAFAATLPRSQYNQALQKMQDDLNLIPENVTVETTKEITVEETKLVPVVVPVEGELSVDGSITLTNTESSAAAYQWQINVDGTWASIDGETAQSLKLTYAMALNALTDANTVQVRCLHFDAEGNLLEACDEFTVPVGTKVEYIEKTTTAQRVLNVTQYTQNETPGEEYNNAWEFQSRARTPVSTYALTAAADTPVLTNYSVVINYVFEDGSSVSDSYTASLAAGSDMNNTTVTFPVVQGYLPYFGTDTESTTSYTLNISNIQADVTYTVTYRPTLVNYTVIHYQQNLNDDDYTEFLTETKEGLTESTVPEVAKVYKDANGTWICVDNRFNGFYSLLYEKPEIAADGSTKVEVYYNRNYYLMNFVLGENAYGVEPVYARYGAAIGDIGTPTRPGYIFQGWLLNNTTLIDTLPATMPAENRTYTAVWKMNETAKVSVVLWGENPNDEGDSYLGTGELELKSDSIYTYNGTDQLYLLCDRDEHNHASDGCTLICGKAEHTQHTEACMANCPHPKHTQDCYKDEYGRALEETTKPNNLNHVQNPIDGSVYSYKEDGFGGTTTYYYLYLDGKWYCSPRVVSGCNVEAKAGELKITLSCSHSHTDACYNCEVHAHTDACYGCGLEQHTHDSNCTGTVAGLDNKLWKFVSSETKTVNPDGSTVINVYYDRTTFTMTFKEKGYNGATLGTIQDKWGANILQRFKTISEENTFFWSMQSNGGSPWTSFMDVMPSENRTYYADPQSGSTKNTATYYGENVEGTGYDTLYTVSFYGSSGLQVSKEEFVVIEGFTFNASLSTKVNGNYNGSKFYYDRNYYSIEFYNPTTLIKKAEGINYGAELDGEYFVPGNEWIPEQYEPGSVEFAGWYLNPECTGERFDFAEHTMPAVPSGSTDASSNNSGATALTVYAKWVPVKRTVEFYLDKNELDAGVSSITTTHSTKTVYHGEKIDPVPANPTNGGYTFVGWFYMEDGVEKAFDFANMSVTKNLKVYGKWSSNVLKEYTVYFKYKTTDENGNPIEIEIADPITGSTLAGETKTFEAKGGSDLYLDYQNGYFPEVESHSITLDIADDSKNTFTFYYEQKDAVPYTVYYVAETLKDGGTGLGTIEHNGKTYHIIAETKNVLDNRKAVVTEKFEAVSGYMPDAYQKRLVVRVGADNKIIFFYEVDSVHAYYKITHYIQNTDGKTWTEYASSEVQGDIGETYDAQPLTLAGFTYDAGISISSGELTADGLELELYYVRNSYPYEVRYLEQNTGKVLQAPKKSTDLYGKVISETAIDIANYTAVEPTSQTLTIKIEESLTEAKLNIITFYYVENVATIKYEVVGPYGCGTVDPESETLKVISGVAQGSTAAVSSSDYKFVGWYSDADCTNQLSTDANYVPTKADVEVWVNTTYYAKFEWNVSTLTISKTVATNPSTGVEIPDDLKNRSFSFQVDLPDGKYPYTIGNTPHTLTVTDGSGTIELYGGQTAEIKNLLVGTRYKVTETSVTGYVPTSKGTEGTITGGITSEAKFTNTYTPHVLTIQKVVERGDANCTNDEFTFKVNIYAGNYTMVKLKDGKEIGRDTFRSSGSAVEITLKAGESVQIHGIPYDTSYTVEEVETTAKMPTGYSFVSATTTNGTVTNKVSTGSMTADTELVYTNEYKTSSLTVTKQVTNHDANVAGRVFTFRIDLKDQNGKELRGSYGIQDTDTKISNGGTFKLAHGESVVITDLPVGAKYTITEVTTGLPGYYTAPAAVSEEIYQDASKNNVTMTNVYNKGDLQITKTVPNAFDPHEEFTFTVNLTNASGSYDWYIGNVKQDGTFTNGDNTVTLKHGQTATIKGLPYGTEYTVSETANSNYTTVASGKTGTIDKATSVAAFTNTHNLADLTVKKIVEASGTTVDRVEEFSFTVTATYNGVKITGEELDTSFELAHNRSMTISGLPVGAVYTVTETAVDDYTTTASNDTGTIAASGNTAMFTNTRKTGKLVISKTVDPVKGFALSDAQKQIEFTFTVTLTPPTNTKFVATDAIFNGLATKSVDANGVLTGTVKLNHGLSLTLDLPVGTQYTVVETPNNDYTVSSENANGTIAADATHTAAFTNSHKPATLNIIKQVKNKNGTEKTGDDTPFTFEVVLKYSNGDPVAKHTFPVCIYTGESTTGTSSPITTNAEGKDVITLKHNQRAEITELLPGMKYSVQEVSIPRGYVCKTATDNNNTVAGNLAVGENEVTFKNSYEPYSLTIKKVVEGGKNYTNDENDTFTFMVSLPVGNYTKDVGTEFNFIREGEKKTVVLEADESVTINNIPINSPYTIEEVLPLTGYTLKTITVGEEPYSLAADDNSISGLIPQGDATITFTNTYKAGTLEIEKKVEGVAAPADDVFSFNVSFFTKADANADPVLVTDDVFSYTVKDAEGNAVSEYCGSISNGTGTIYLKHGYTATITDIPEGTCYTVEEESHADYTTEVQQGSDVKAEGNVAAGAIEGNATKKVTFTNTYKYGTLTIVKNFADGNNHADEVFVFNVSGRGIDTDVVIAGADSVTIDHLPINKTYTVTEKTDWSWRYSSSCVPANGSVTITKDANGTVTFTNTRTNDQYIDDSVSAENIFGGRYSGYEGSSANDK